MTKFLSKIQYNGYERGEFSDAAERTLAETIKLIDDYPWEKDCIITSVGLDKPGIVIQNKTGDYLKIGSYYHNSFCLYLLMDGKYYVRITDTFEDLLIMLNYLFDGQDIAQYCNREYTLGVKGHFISKDFIYKVTLRRILWFMLWTILCSIPFTFFLCEAIVESFPGDGLIVLWILWFLICGINWLLFINYFIQSGNLFLKVSAGQSKFLFGTRKNYKQYDKKDIDTLIVYECKIGYRWPPWIGFEVNKMIFKDGTQIRFTTLLISSWDTAVKFSNVNTIIEKRRIPFSKLGRIF